jgi:DNA-binding CsgD family transcriptional regulator
VKFHLTIIYRKLGVSSRTEAVHSAYERGILERPLSYVA